MYILANEPKSSGTPLAGAFDAIDQAVGTEEFSRDVAVAAISAHVDVDTSEAESLFRDLVSGDYVTEV